ncbi:hypothetical protein [Brucella haematophila]|jgi:hypothetical protein|uniref:Uncharacterized protein n=1 Tax=Brucella haematophila TaxID=419474 RepID=A0ABX1DNG1_9HYPH|nr:hypothetical protein [Brucella haematophila]KAB2694092.1 hypothetical protein F9K79_20920 [Ochrobactrum sp. Kaboul]NKC04459.1 hypothetical protein [Brucella haematophila]TMU84709.1 hypothetical protein FGI60_25945 [Brucella haematophila]
MAPVIFVQSFTAGRWGVIPDVPIQVERLEEAERLAVRLSASKAAVIAVYKWNNQAEVIAMFGRVPENILEAANG